jgi:hypothetical protein
VWPDKVAATVSGNGLLLEGYYCAAAWAGLVGYASVGSGFTNRTISGFTAVYNSNGYFSRSELDSVAGGGTFITIQDTPTSPLKCRHQLSTDVSSVEKRELNITKSIDYVAKYIRDSISGKVGVHNITNSLMDSLSFQIQGMLDRFMSSGVIIEGKLSSIEVDSSSPDTLNIVVLISVPYPCNYIALTLQI